MCADEYAMRAKKHRKYHMGLVTRQGAEKSLSDVSEKQFRANFAVPPTIPDQAVEAKVKLYHNSIFFAGSLSFFPPPFCTGDKRWLESNPQSQN
jgi:hypothetical protein